MKLAPLSSSSLVWTGTDPRLFASSPGWLYHDSSSASDFWFSPYLLGSASDHRIPSSGRVHDHPASTSDCGPRLQDTVWINCV
ncbi:hypothetical protein BCR33DRAFT_721623, partial [Rhizoclosmatium globosum]